ncbi:MAG TPA: inorganic diphosphatase [Candidatus Acidoferrales bacterium]|jgi:inorganic pyrophosphatase|nr:inorganic diphosphatase [Candidatus Acidoferrales bacterium]
MAKNGKSPKGNLANPSRLSAVDEDDDEVFIVVIETPRGCRNKYAFDPDQRVFSLKKVLPAGMAFPYDFGFLPSTEGGDGDPIDVLVLMDEPAFPGCVVRCRLIGVIQGEQTDGKDVERNDRILAVEIGTHSWDDVRHVDDLGKQFAKELAEFFVNYHELTGKEYRILGVKGPGAATKCIEKGMKAAKKGSQ